MPTELTKTRENVFERCDLNVVGALTPTNRGKKISLHSKMLSQTFSGGTHRATVGINGTLHYKLKEDDGHLTDQLFADFE